ncbi:MAG: YggS family pyridoxal phosphate-dependent enzyme, partial [Paracoccaceae bacterium]
MALADITRRIDAATNAAGRTPGSVRLVAISKQQPADRIIPVLNAGHRIFGENKVQEAAAKWPALRDRFSGVQLHLIGPLQTNKARQAMALFDVIQTLDRPRLANTLARIAQDLGTCPDLMVQVNTGSEPQKAGVLPGDADGFIAECRALDLPLRGVMCIPPETEPPTPP